MCMRVLMQNPEHETKPIDIELKKFEYRRIIIAVILYQSRGHEGKQNSD